jgi:hypothetical protein
MTIKSKKYRTWLLLWSLIWAFVITAVAFYFKGKPVEYWIESTLLVGAITSFTWNYERLGRRR